MIVRRVLSSYKCAWINHVCKLWFTTANVYIYIRCVNNKQNLTTLFRKADVEQKTWIHTWHIVSFLKSFLPVVLSKIFIKVSEGLWQCLHENRDQLIPVFLNQTKASHPEGRGASLHYSCSIWVTRVLSTWCQWFELYYMFPCAVTKSQY